MFSGKLVLPIQTQTLPRTQVGPNIPLVLNEMSNDERQQLCYTPQREEGKGWEGNARNVHHPLHGCVCVCVSKYVNTVHTPHRLEACRSLPEVKWALDWVIQQSHLLNNTNTSLPQRDCDKYLRREEGWGGWGERVWFCVYQKKKERESENATAA